MDYTLIRSRRRSVAVQIAPDLGVLVRAPVRMPKADIDRFVEAHRDWIAVHTERRRRYQQAFPEPTTEQLAAWKEEAKAQIPGRVAHYASRMGLAPAGVRITAAKTRFGSCSGKDRLCFSCLLMRHPPEAVDYVVVHELAHIRHKNHGKEFYALIEATLPDWRARRALLKTPADGGSN